MTKIVPNDLLKPTEKCIKVWNCSFIAVEGPNVMGKLMLEDIAIPYTSQYRSRLVLNANSTDQPLLYGFLGEEVTYLMIKATYDQENDPYYIYEKEKYNITYYYEGESTERPIGRLMILTGSDEDRIPQIYLNNPYNYEVVLDVLVATLEQGDLDASNFLAPSIFTNLYYSSIISNISNTEPSGSTQLVVLNTEANPVMYIPYINISLVTLDISDYRITITTTNEEEITFKFLTEFDMYQAYTRIIWVRQKDGGFIDGANRYMTTDEIYWYNSGFTGVDTDPPVIIYNETGSSTIPTGLTLDLYHSGDTGMKSGWTKAELITELISGVTDNWDGDIDTSNVLVTIVKSGTVPTLDEVDELGIHNIMFDVTDLANNLDSDIVVIEFI